MKKTGLFPSCCLLILGTISFPSCHGQSNSNTPASAPPDGVTMPDKDLQIDDYVVEVFEDKRGQLWFGTMAKGAARYDGKSLTYFSKADGLCDETVASIAEDRQGNIWFGTHNGASKFNGITLTNYGIREGLIGSGCQFLVDRQGNFWAGTTDGVFRFDGRTFIPFDLPNPGIVHPSFKVKAGKVWNMMEDRRGNIWFARDGYGACRYDGSSFKHYTKKDGLASNNVSRVIEDRQGNIWFACLTSDVPKNDNEGGLTRFNGSTFTGFPKIKGLAENDIYTIFEDSSGLIWIGATNTGVYRYDGNTFTLFDRTDRMDLTVHFGLQNMIEDHTGKLWFAFSGGLFRFDGTMFRNVTRSGPWRDER